MEAREIKYWHLTSGIHYITYTHDSETCFIRTTKALANKVLLALFEEDNEKIFAQKNYPYIQDLVKIGAVKAAEYAKRTLDAVSVGIIPEPIAAIALEALIFQVSLEWEDVMTERLVGKKRIEFWKKSFTKYSVEWEDPKIFALLNMWGNDSELLNKFVEDNCKDINYIISDCEY